MWQQNLDVQQGKITLSSMQLKIPKHAKRQEMVAYNWEKI